jgi:hypothetical protein
MMRRVTSTGSAGAAPNRSPRARLAAKASRVLISRRSYCEPEMMMLAAISPAGVLVSRSRSAKCSAQPSRAGLGKVLPPIQVDVAENFGFPSPATDATGNTFVTYNPGRYDGVIVLIPDADGFEDIGWDDQSGDTHYSGKRAYYYANLAGTGDNGEYTIRKSRNDCTPSCAEGTVTTQDLHWDGSDYVP